MHPAGRADRAWRSLRGLPGRTPLRVKMLTAVLALVIAGLAVCTFVSRAVFADYLTRQAQSRLTSYSQVVEPWVTSVLTGGQRIDRRAALLDDGPDRTWVLNASGQQLQFSFGSQGSPGPAPQVPTSQSWLRANEGQTVTVPGPAGTSDNWLVITRRIPDVPVANPATGQLTVQTVTVVVGTDLGNISASINYLTEIDLLVSAAVVLVLALIGVAVVRASLRPLTDIEHTAAAIAAGELSRRVPDRDPRTEVGRLGGSLNAMLTQIEVAFAARTRSEEDARRSEQRMRQFLADASHELRTPLTAIRGFAEYYRQRGGVAPQASLPGQPAQVSSANGATASDTAPTGATANDAAAHGTAEDGAAEDGAPASSAAADGATADGAPVSSTALNGATANGATADSAAVSSAAADSDGPLGLAELDRIMQRLEQESSRMGVLVEDMLLLARLDQQRPLEQRPVDMLMLAADAVHDARVVAPQREISLTVGSGAALLVLGDEVRLRQVIGNLMTNAINYTPETGPIRVQVRSGTLSEWHRAAQATGQGPWAGAQNGPGRTALAVAGHSHAPAVPAVVLEVADSGPGLTPEQAEHVFERFYRADQARTRRAGGAGLGLSIVAALVTAHGGVVWAESVPGSGATFRIAIPLAPEARHSDPEPGDSADADDSLEPGGATRAGGSDGNGDGPEILHSARPLIPPAAPPGPPVAPCPPAPAGPPPAPASHPMPAGQPVPAGRHLPAGPPPGSYRSR